MTFADDGARSSFRGPLPQLRNSPSVDMRNTLSRDMKGQRCEWDGGKLARQALYLEAWSIPTAPMWRTFVETA